jgi:hypothetical protein
VIGLILLIVAMALIGAGCVIAGVYLLLGTAWAMIVGGAGLLLAAAILRRGMSNG